MRHLAFAACLTLVASLFVVLIGYGYEINEGGSPLSPWLPAAGLVLLLSLGTLIWALQKQGGWVRLGLWPRRYKPSPEQVRTFADQVARQKAYAADRTMLATCAHLQPIERAMRQQNVRVRLLYGIVVEARCTIDATRLQLEDPVVFYGEVPGDRPGEPPSAHFHCREHHSNIAVDHPASAQPGTPVFPAAA